MFSEKEEKYLADLIAKAKAKCKESYGVEITKEIKIDRNKSLEDNKKAIIEQIKEEKELKVREMGSKSKPKAQEKPRLSEEERKKEMEELNKIVQEANRNIKSEDKEINQYYERLRNSIERLHKGYINSIFVCGKAGTGKTHQIISKLNEMNLEPSKDYVEFAGEMSSAFVYRFLSENNGKILIFRDLINLITTMRSLELLKTATETREPRIVRKGNYSKETEDLKDYFECKSKFIFEFNNLRYNGLQEDIEALLSRGDFITLSLSFDDIANIMLKIAKESWQEEITKFLIRNYKFVGINALNLRTQQKCFGIYKWATETEKNWKEEIMKYLASEMSYIRRLLYTYMGDKAIKSSELKKILVLAHIDGVNTLRSASRRLHDWILMGELFIVGFVSYDEDELETFMNTHRNYAVSLNPIERLKITEEEKVITEVIKPQDNKVAIDTTPKPSIEEVKSWRQEQN